MTTTNATYLGVDPGLSGAIALWTPATDALEIHDVPVFKIKKKSRVDVRALARIFATTQVFCLISLAVIEDVCAMPRVGLGPQGVRKVNMGTQSSFNFGKTAGYLEMGIAANAIPYRLVRPNQWKQVYGLSSDKDDSRRIASQLFPNHAVQWARKKDDGRAEAALLAHYAKRIDTP